MSNPLTRYRSGSWYEATARERVTGLLDAGSFHEFVGPEQRQVSPHLPLFDLPEAFDDGIVVGRGKIRGETVLLAAQEGRFMGGTFGEVHGAKLVGLLRDARDHAPQTVLLLLDTGGVRLQEANAGELAVSEIIRALLEARAAGVKVLALIGGRAGAFGGGGIVTACCGRIVVSEQGRTSVTGPEVIETNMGAEEFDSRDRPLVWRTTGGKTRRLLGGADAFASDSIDSFRDAVMSLIKDAPPFDLETMEREQARLARRLERFGRCGDAPEIWRAMGIAEPEGVADLSDDAFVQLAQAQRRATMTPDDLSNALFPAGYETSVEADGILHGTGTYGNGQTAAVLGVVGQTPLGVDGALVLTGHLLNVLRQSPGRPVVVLIDAASQRMRRRDELLGLNEYLAHAAKCFTLAALRGHRTVGVLFGTVAAGAFLATGLALERLVAVPGGNPMVMDLPSVARVTKLPLERLEALSKDTPVFAPGLAYSLPIGAVAEVWESGGLAERLAAVLSEPPGGPDRRRPDRAGA